MSDPPAAAPPEDLMPANPRFGWPMRIFLFVLVFNMVFRSHMSLFPWTDWMEELEMERRPVRLASQREIANLASRASEANPHPLRDDLLASADSVWEYWRPWPSPKTRPKLRTGKDWTKYTLAWMSSRFDFVETILGINQDWPMFSPNVSKKKWLTRCRLIYADGSQKIVRQTADPEDLTCYSHWFQEKILDYELHIREGEGRVVDCEGYCNLLAHRHPRSEGDSPLARIELFQIWYAYCPPGEDPVAFYRAQNGPPADQVSPTFFKYDAATKSGKMLPPPQTP